MCDFSDGCFFFQAEDGIRDLVRSRGLGDVYKRQGLKYASPAFVKRSGLVRRTWPVRIGASSAAQSAGCLLYTSDAADERSSVDLGGRRIIKKKQQLSMTGARIIITQRV
mgnify:CR=1 FL=1